MTLLPFFNVSKNFKLSIFFLVIGWLYFWVISYLNYADFLNQFEDNLYVTICIPKPGKYDSPIYKIISISIGVLSLYFSIKTKEIKSNRKTLLILSSVVLIIFSYFFLWRIIFDMESLIYDY